MSLSLLFDDVNLLKFLAHNALYSRPSVVILQSELGSVIHESKRTAPGFLSRVCNEDQGLDISAVSCKFK